MSRTVGSTGASTQAAIRRAAAKLIATHGFEAMTLRQLAAEVGVQSGTLYRYFPSKADLLHTLLVDVMQDLISAWETQKPADAGPLELMKAFIEIHLRYHVTHRDEAFIADLELRSLSRKSYRVVTGLRARYENILRDILVKGVRAGHFKVPEMKVAVYGILAMLTGVYVWYRNSGPLSMNALVKHYTALIMNGIADR